MINLQDLSKVAIITDKEQHTYQELLYKINTHTALFWFINTPMESGIKQLKEDLPWNWETWLFLWLYLNVEANLHYSSKHRKSGQNFFRPLVGESPFLLGKDIALPLTELSRSSPSGFVEKSPPVVVFFPKTLTIPVRAILFAPEKGLPSPVNKY